MRQLPRFPSLCSIWSATIAGAWPAALKYGYAPSNVGLPRLTDVRCELVGRPYQASFGVYNAATMNVWTSGSVCIYVPKGTDIRDGSNQDTFCDTVLVDGKWLCIVNAVYPIGYGFPNEFLCALCSVDSPHGVP